MRHAPRAAMLTLLAAVAVTGCGGKSTSTPTKSGTTPHGSGQASTTQKPPSRPPAY